MKSLLFYYYYYYYYYYCCCYYYFSLLIWSEKHKNGIFSTSINGTGEVTEVMNVTSPYPLTINFRTNSLYTMGQSTGELKTSKIDGSNEKVLSRKLTNSGLVQSATMYDDKIYFTKNDISAVIEYVVMEDTTVEMGNYFTTSFESFNDMAIVHHSNQPSGTEYINIITNCFFEF